MYCISLQKVGAKLSPPPALPVPTPMIIYNIGISQVPIHIIGKSCLEKTSGICFKRRGIENLK